MGQSLGGDKPRTARGRYKKNIRVLDAIVWIGDEWDRSEALAFVVQSYGQMRLYQRVYDLLPSIYDDHYFLQTCKAIFSDAQIVSEEKAGKFVIDAIFNILPIAAQHSRRVYLKVIGEAVPSIIKHFPADEARSVLVFLEEQWNA